MVRIGLMLAVVVLAGDGRSKPEPGNAPPAPRPTPASPLASQEARDYDSPPPGSKADQALWKEAYEGDNRIISVRSVASRLQARAKAYAYQERLEVLASQGQDAAARAHALRDKLLAAWKANVELMVRQWPVDRTRVCRYPRLAFESAMYSEAAPGQLTELASARRDLEQCVRKTSLVLRAADRSNKRFEDVLAELDRELADVEVPGNASPQESTSEGIGTREGPAK